MATTLKSSLLKCLPIKLDSNIAGHGNITSLGSIGSMTQDTIQQIPVSTNNLIRVHGQKAGDTHVLASDATTDITHFVQTDATGGLTDDDHAKADMFIRVFHVDATTLAAGKDSIACQILPDVNATYTVGFYKIDGTDPTKLVHVGVDGSAPDYFQDAADCIDLNAIQLYLVVNATLTTTEGVTGSNYQTRGSTLFYMVHGEGSVNRVDSWETTAEPTVSYRLSNVAADLCFMLREGAIMSGILNASLRAAVLVQGSVINSIADAIDKTGNLTKGELATALGAQLLTLASGTASTTTSTKSVYLLSNVTVAQLKNLMVSACLADAAYTVTTARDTSNFLFGTSGMYAEIEDNGADVTTKTVYSSTGAKLGDTVTMNVLYVGNQDPNAVDNSISNRQQIYLDGDSIASMTSHALKKTIRRDHSVNLTKFNGLSAQDQADYEAVEAAKVVSVVAEINTATLQQAPPPPVAAAPVTAPPISGSICFSTGMDV